MSRSKCLLLAAAAGVCLASAAHASVLMLNFGSTAVGEADRTNSPYHDANPAFTDTAWNQIEFADVNSGLVYADGAAATGVAVNLGQTADFNGRTIDLASQPDSTLTGNNTNTGVFADTSVGRYGVFKGGTWAGLQITGLAAGTYDVYVVSRHTGLSSNTSNLPITYTAAAGAGSSGNFDFGTYTETGSVTFTSATNEVNAWVEDGNAGANYIKLTVTLTAGQALNIGTEGLYEGTPPAPKASMLNAVQIVPVPEPAAVAGLGLAAPLLLLRRRRA